MPFFASPRARRLERDHQEMVQLREQSTVLDFRAQGSPPESYRLVFRGRGLDAPEGFRDVHEVELSLGGDYPRQMPHVSWLTPIRHPNISGASVCFGNFTMTPFVRLTEIVEILWDMARMAAFNPHGGYQSADQWYRIMREVGGFPLDMRILRDRAPQAPPEEPGEPEIIIMGARHRMGAVEGWAVTHDGETLKTFPTEQDAWKWLHNRHSYSVDHAVRHEGYDVVFVRGGKVEHSYRRDALARVPAPRPETPEQAAQRFEDAVREAFIQVYGPPRTSDPDTAVKAIRSSFLERGRALGWVHNPDPRVVIVLTEYAWVADPWASEEDHDDWDRVMVLLRQRGWGHVWWDSINSGVQIVIQEAPPA